MKCLIRGIVFLVVIGSTTVRAAEPDAAALAKSLNWINGPKTANVGNYGSFAIPKGYAFLSPPDSKRWLEEVTKNLSSGSDHVFGPVNGSWWAKLQHEGIGYVKDDEKIDADALMKAMRTEQEAANKERQKRGYPMLLDLAWKYPPFYDPATKRLEWATSFVESDTKSETVNYETRILGRKGVTSVTLVVSTGQLPAAIPEFKTAVMGFTFVEGQRYTEFREGDKVAEYGLAALVAGSAAALLSKAGFFTKYWKLLLGAGAAILAGIGHLLKSKDKR